MSSSQDFNQGDQVRHVLTRFAMCVIGKTSVGEYRCRWYNHNTETWHVETFVRAELVLVSRTEPPEDFKGSA